MGNTSDQVVGPVPEQRTGAYGWYVVIILMLCQALSSLDAKLPFILIEALKKDLDLSDTQIGLVTGPAFSLTYALAAIPIARLSDRYVRKHVISASIAAWSALTLAGGFAMNFAAFGLSRAGVAVGEAGLAPAAHAVIAGHTSPANRPIAMGVYALGTAIGASMALVVGGYVSDRFGWRMTLFAVGASGVVLVLLVAATVREAPQPQPGDTLASPPRGSVRRLLADSAIRNIVIGGALMGLSTGAVNAWAPTYVMRKYAMSATDTGASFGAMVGLIGIAGLFAGGVVASWLGRRRFSNAYRVLSLMFLVATLFQVASFIVEDYGVFLILTAVSILLVAFYFAPTYAGVQTLTHPATRSFAAAVTIFFVNGIGIASGSFLAGFFSDVLRPAFGADSLRWSLVILTLMKPWSALHYFLAARAIDRREAAIA